MSTCYLKTSAVVPAILPPHNPIHFSPRQHEILMHLGEGLSNKRIARALDIAEGTVKQHIKCVLYGLGAANRLQAVIFAYRMGLLTPTFQNAAPAGVGDQEHSTCAEVAAPTMLTTVAASA